jgi:hypothetical protein
MPYSVFGDILIIFGKNYHEGGLKHNKRLIPQESRAFNYFCNLTILSLEWNWPCSRWRKLSMVYISWLKMWCSSYIIFCSVQNFQWYLFLLQIAAFVIEHLGVFENLQCHSRLFTYKIQLVQSNRKLKLIQLISTGGNIFKLEKIIISVAKFATQS